MWKACFLSGLAALALAGCAGRKQVAEMSYAEQQAFVQDLAAKCAEQGYGPENPQHMNCVNHEVRREVITRQNAQVQQQRVGQAIAAGMQGYGNSLQASAAANRPITCTSRSGSYILGAPVTSVNTTCY